MNHSDDHAKHSFLFEFLSHNERTCDQLPRLDATRHVMKDLPLLDRMRHVVPLEDEAFSTVRHRHSLGLERVHGCMRGCMRGDVSEMLPKKARIVNRGENEKRTSTSEDADIWNARLLSTVQCVMLLLSLEMRERG